ncbi:protein-glutamate methylesterase/protein-glutamine glutaminase [Paenibacillus xylaniclasticus]|uniref:protein-glutamate methylesterase/protein-glutamine glutaminase n=1 Tax=Paenibacillus xylaniclasticus TaxID=588083 RepID=UPI000FDCAFF3|nr:MULTISPECIES: chemotaxis response regulator protein-glutamate methylesterase [Paenibacillus]GFN30459.1 chemotaxis response regulator protein-glutamate methylesterase [Paenibacillus curdlanolyticus]
MHVRNKIKVLVVDDSMVFREVISRGITTDPDIDVVATACDPFEARDKLLQYHPNVMICDVHMPRMTGIEFLRRLLPQYSLPVIVVSTVSSTVFDAMNAGAIDFITKPDAQLSHVEKFIEELIEKVKTASKAKIVHHDKKTTELVNSYHPSGHMNTVRENPTAMKLIAIGASTGGTETIYTLLKSLPQDLPGIVIVQHIPPMFSRMFAERLNQSLPFHVKEAQTGDMIEKGKVLIAPGDQHMRVKKAGDHFKVECFRGEKVNRHCPSIDVLFESVAKEVGSQSIGIILTGMGYDGAKGLLSMKRKGARTIGQDEQSSVVYGMPKVAFDLGAVEQQSSLSNLPRVISKLL